MAKVEGSFITKIKGSIGNTTFRQNGKNNVASQKAASVKNPCTPEQIKQRMYSRVVNSAYSAMKELCNHSFEGVKNGAESMSYFLSANQSLLKSKETDQTLFVPKGTKRVFAPNNYLISEGSLTTPEMFAGYTGDDYKGAEIGDDWGKAETVGEVTVKQLHDFLNARIGDQITLVSVDFATAANSFRISDPQPVTMWLTRYIFREGTETNVAFNKTDGTLIQANLDLKKSQLGQLALFGGKNGESATNFSIFAAKEGSILAAPTIGIATGYILSRKGDNGTWQRSTSYLAVNQDYWNNTYFHEDSNFLYSKCYDTYTSNNTDYELNNAED